MTVRKDDMRENPAATEEHNDFDALLDASSLGAPHVRAETTTVPADVHRRFTAATAALTSTQPTRAPGRKVAREADSSLLSRCCRALNADRRQELWKPGERGTMLWHVGGEASSIVSEVEWHLARHHIALEAIHCSRQLEDRFRHLLATALPGPTPYRDARRPQSPSQNLLLLMYTPRSAAGETGTTLPPEAARLLRHLSRRATQSTDVAVNEHRGDPSPARKRQYLTAARLTDCFLPGHMLTRQLQRPPSTRLWRPTADAHDALTLADFGEFLEKYRIRSLIRHGFGTMRSSPTTRELPTLADMRCLLGISLKQLSVPSPNWAAHMPLSPAREESTAVPPTLAWWEQRNTDLTCAVWAWLGTSTSACHHRRQRPLTGPPAQPARHSNDHAPASTDHGSAACEQGHGRSEATLTPSGVRHAAMSMRLRSSEADSEGLTVPVRFTYRSNDPYAVEATFMVGQNGETIWSFGRDLLAAGLHDSAGEGDVIVWTRPPSPHKSQPDVFIRLRSPDGNALLSVPHAHLKAFIETTERLVPSGTEHEHVLKQLDKLDGEMRQLTSTGGND